MFDNNNDSEVVMVAQAVSQKTEKMVEYIRALKTLEDAMEPYKEQKRELRDEFKRQGWLSKDEISTTVKAYRMMKNDVDLDQFVELYQTLLERSGRGV
jgi:hypothetical protein